VTKTLKAGHVPSLNGESQKESGIPVKRLLAQSVNSKMDITVINDVKTASFDTSN
jgi:hypothetical protein